jgi:hypothetical protein
MAGPACCWQWTPHLLTAPPGCMAASYGMSRAQVLANTCWIFLFFFIQLACWWVDHGHDSLAPNCQSFFFNDRGQPFPSRSLPVYLKSACWDIPGVSICARAARSLYVTSMRDYLGDRPEEFLVREGAAALLALCACLLLRSASFCYSAVCGIVILSLRYSQRGFSWARPVSGWLQAAERGLAAFMMTSIRKWLSNYDVRSRIEREQRLARHAHSCYR